MTHTGDAVPDFNPDRPVVEVWDVSNINGQAGPAILNLHGFSPTSGGQYLWSGSHLGQVFGLAIDHNPDGPYIYAAETAIYGGWYGTGAAWSNNFGMDCDLAPYSAGNPNPNCYPGNASLSAPNNNNPAFTQPPPPGLFAFPAPLPASGNQIPLPNSHLGAVWRLSLKADLSTNNDPHRTYELAALIPTNRMSLGQIAYNPDADTFYVSNFADGLIYIFNNPPVGGPPVTSGFVTYDHGATQGIGEIHAQFTAYGRRVWGLQYNAAEHRLYYAVWNADDRYRRTDNDGNAIPNQIWSVDLDASGHPVAGTTVKQLDLPYYPNPLPTTQIPCYQTAFNPVCISYSQPVSDIAFNEAGDVMLLAERGEHIGRVIGAGYDNSANGKNILAHSSRVLRYRKDQATGQWAIDTTYSWPPNTPNPFGQYSGDNVFNNPNTPAQVNGWHTDATGGVDFGFGYTTDAGGNNTILDPAARDKWVWNGTNSGATLNTISCYYGHPASPACPLVYGLMGAELPGSGALAPVPNAGTGISIYPNSNLYYVDFDGDPLSITKAAMGDVEVNRFLGAGKVKICKVAGAGIEEGTPFSFTVSGHADAVTIPAGPAPGGWCKEAGAFDTGTTVTITEQPVPGVSASDIHAEPASAVAGQLDLANGTVNLQIGTGVTEVTFTNARPTGYLEICKSSDAPGLFTFDVQGAGNVTVPAGACSPALKVPAGNVLVRELTSGFNLTACATEPFSRLQACELDAREAKVSVVAGGIADQTILHLTNATIKPSTGEGTLKICKVAGDGLKAGGTYWFMGKTVSVTSGSGPGGLCRIAGTYPAGTAITVDEWPTDGVIATAIDVQPASAISEPADLAAGKVGIRLGAGVTEVTFTNARPSAYIEICKAANVAGSFDFKIESYGTVTVPSGSCSPALKVTAGLVKINESMPALYSLTACATLPAGRLDTCDLPGHSLVVNVPAGGMADQTIINLTNYRCVDTPKHPCFRAVGPENPRMLTDGTAAPPAPPAPAAQSAAKPKP